MIKNYDPDLCLPQNLTLLDQNTAEKSEGLTPIPHIRSYTSTNCSKRDKQLSKLPKIYQNHAITYFTQCGSLSLSSKIYFLTS